ncbi:MauE/DoxX family redox-associated membrane protein [Paenibacillus chitinolyticus]|uniref:MauE/DoxX family redox-associated membrane protein n=1 Tax=Paenibacillus chitinolyticus TaxID=79263 RepID=UPI00386672B6
MDYLLRVVLAQFFLLAFIMKVRSLHNFRLEISSYNVIPSYLIAIASYLIIFVEIGIIISFVFDLFSFWKQIVCLFMLVIFNLLTWKKNKETKKSACSCFGNLSFLNRYPIRRNIVLLIITFATLFFPESKTSFFFNFHVILFLIWLSLLIILVSEKREVQKTNAA